MTSALCTRGRWSLCCTDTAEFRCESSASTLQLTPGALTQRDAVLDLRQSQHVVSAGATMVLFCAEAVEWVYSGMFGKPWKKVEYLRTDCFRAAAATVQCPARPAPSTRRLSCWAMCHGRSTGGPPSEALLDDCERQKRASAPLPAVLRLARPAEQHQW